MSSGMARAGWVSFSWMATCIDTGRPLQSSLLLVQKWGPQLPTCGDWAQLWVPVWKLAEEQGAGHLRTLLLPGLSTEPATWLLCPTGPFTASQARSPGTWRPRLPSCCLPSPVRRSWKEEAPPGNGPALAPHLALGSRTLSGNVSKEVLTGSRQPNLDDLKRRMMSCRVAATTKYSCFSRSSFPSKNCRHAQRTCLGSVLASGPGAPNPGWGQAGVQPRSGAKVR